jgi:hypothetical protein
MFATYRPSGLQENRPLGEYIVTSLWPIILPSFAAGDGIHGRTKFRGDMHFSTRQSKTTKAPSHDEASRSLPRPVPSKPFLDHPLLKLQRAIGNQNTERLLRARLEGSPSVPSIVHEALHSPGEPLDSTTRVSMERHFGHDFAQVRVHTDSKAIESAHAVNALAYTVGNHMVFAGGKYQPQSGEGRKLLAHELAHTVQQEGAGFSPADKLEIGKAADTYEHQADSAAEGVIHGSNAPILEPTPLELSRMQGWRLQRQTPPPVKDSHDFPGVAAQLVGSRAERLSQGPKLLFSGQAAASAVTRLLPTANTITVIGGFGPVELRPGTIWSGDRMLISADTVLTYYTIGDGLYEWSTAAFIREEWFRAAGQAAAQAELFVKLAKVEIALIEGLLVPWYFLLGVSAAGLGLSIYHNRATYQAALDQAPRVIQLLRDFKERCPTLYKRLLTTAAKETLANLPSGVTAEDVAFLLGRIVGGMAGATLQGGRGLYTVATAAAPVVILRTVKTVLLVIGMHSIGIAGRALKQAVADRISNLQTELAAQGTTITWEEAEQIIREIEANPDTPRKLEELHQSIEQLLPYLERLSRALPYQ